MAQKTIIIFAATVFVICVFYLQYDVLNEAWLKKQQENTVGFQYSLSNEHDQSSKLILDWTKFFGNTLASQWSYQVTRACPHLLRKCIFTNDKNLSELVDAIVFHYREIKWDKLPRIRNPNQKYVFFLLESPYHTGNVAALSSKGKHFFNWTMTYRTDSDVLWPYGLTVPRLKKTNQQSSELETLFPKKRLSIAWFVSNCRTSSEREVYVAKLNQSIAVDSFGACGENKCDRRNPSKCDNMLKTDYFFYLAFENSVCKDYITEKFFSRALQNFVIPIVLSDEIYRNIAPNGSYIAADFFNSTVDLANYLRYLMGNRTAYLEYFEWQRTLEFASHSASTGLCGLCKKLLGPETPRKSHEDLQQWWMKDAKCESRFGRKLISKEFVADRRKSMNEKVLMVP